MLGVVLMTACLTACGGGGSGSSGSGSSDPTGTGLVPVAPTVGATLYADASSLRPLRNAATWHYRGTRSVASDSANTTTSYLTTTTQSDVTTGGATESTTNSGANGADTQKLVVSGGVVYTQQSIDFTGKGVPPVVNVVELRSPVRQGDQYTILDQTFTDTAIDADGDGKMDSVDIGIYAQVIGLESVALTNLPTVNAVRVDTFIRERVTYSSTGKSSPVVQLSLSTWYVDGLGIVRQAARRPAASGSVEIVTDEQLLSWDGGSVGFGVMEPISATIPAENHVFGGYRLPFNSFRFKVFPFADHVLLLTDTYGDSPNRLGSVLLSRFDLRGKVLGATEVPFPEICDVLTAHKSGVICVHPFNTVDHGTYGLTRLDANGSLIGSVDGSTLNLKGNRDIVFNTQALGTIDGDTLWLLWERRFRSPETGLSTYELLVQPFSLDGVPLAGETLVKNGRGFPGSLAGMGGRVVFSWLQENGNKYDLVLGSISLNAGLTTRAFLTGLPQSNVFVDLVNLGGNAAAVWSQIPGTNTGGVGGVYLNETLDPRLMGSSVTGELFGGMPPFDWRVPSFGVSSNRLSVLSNQTYATLWPGDNSTTGVSTLSWIDAATTPLIARPVNSVRWEDPGWLAHVNLGDRAMVFGNALNYAGLTTTIVWLNKGSSSN